MRNKSGEPFKAFTPFYKACQALEPPLHPLAAPTRLQSPKQWPASETLDGWGLEPSRPDWAAEMRRAWTPGEAGDATRLQGYIGDAIADYGTNRNRPDLDGTSRLSPHLAFGEVSPRQIWHAVSHAAEADTAKQRGAAA